MAIHPGGSQLNIANGIREFAHATPHSVAIIDGDRTLTFGAINERASRLASGLLKAGLKKGDTVALLLGNRFEYPEIAAGLAMAGLVLIPLNPRQVANEIAFVLEHASIQAIIVDSALAGNLPTVDYQKLSLLSKEMK